jgi:hypothetical protein
MRLIILEVIVIFGITAGAITSANADRVPTDHWERLDRERY